MKITIEAETEEEFKLLNQEAKTYTDVKEYFIAGRMLKDKVLICDIPPEWNGSYEYLIARVGFLFTLLKTRFMLKQMEDDANGKCNKTSGL